MLTLASGPLLGLVLAGSLPQRDGAPRHCPAGSRPAACAYPADLFHQRVHGASWELAASLLLLLVLSLARALRVGDEPG